MAQLTGPENERVVEASLMPVEPDSPEYGRQLAARRLALGLSPNGPGRPSGRWRQYQGEIEAAERLFAGDLEYEAARYIDKLEQVWPERCPTHGVTLACGINECDYQSQRTLYNFKAAQYIFDRMMGRPTNRNENTVTITLIQSVLEYISQVFLKVNNVEDAISRREAFANELDRLGATIAGGFSQTDN